MSITQMIPLNSEQKIAVKHEGNVLVTACPGSGKTRVLTCRAIKGLEEIPTIKHRVIALTFTNRAADEIQVRLDQAHVDTGNLWAGTIHGFALEWILRPYAPYLERIRRGFTIADEFKSEKILTELKETYERTSYFIVNTARNREGLVLNNDAVAVSIYEDYQRCMQESKLLDYDDILFYAYRILVDVPEIAETLASIIRLICLDEIQDTQDLHYGILSKIYRATNDPPILFLVGDADQSIYESLGAITKTANEIVAEFGDSITQLGLTGNYRSTQRIIDYYQNLRTGPRIESLTEYAQERGVISFQNHSIEKDDLPETIAQLIRSTLQEGVAQHDICVLAPHWWHVRSLGRRLVQLLPDVDFDAPGLSPLHSQRDNLWFRIARLFLTTPSPNLYRTRLRWAKEVIRDLEANEGVYIPVLYSKPRAFLRLVNSISSNEEDGIEYLRYVFFQLITMLNAEIEAHPSLKETQDLFFTKAQERLNDIGDDAPTNVATFRKLFKHPSGVIISTCHGIKGEEYNTVIAFGLLKGYIPNWNVIINGDPEIAEDRASKLLYVVCSRAKKRLHLIAERGRFTRTGNQYVTAAQLTRIQCSYDPPPM